MSLKLCENSSEEEETKENVGIQPQKIEEQMEKLQILQLSMQSKEGFTSNKSFKVWVKVKDKELLTLIDSGATNNFIDSRLVKELDLKVVETPTYVIETSLVSWKAMVKALTDEGLGFYLQTLETDTRLSPPELTEWRVVLDPFEEVFHLPTGLPPMRDHDHAIRLKVEVAIPNLKPYRAPPVLVKGDTPFSVVDEVNKLIAERNMMLKEMHEQLLKAQDVMRSQANKHRRQMDYEVGDMVFLKIQPYKMKKLAKRVNQKLSPRYYGPYEILQKIGAMTYKLKLPEDTRVHPVFYVSLLKKAVTPNMEPQPLRLNFSMNEEWHLEPIPEKVLEARRNEQGEVEVLVKWKNPPDFETHGN
ncbi:hypothetical protein KIW84_015671 [Lathyrus oleraceus]|uniref:Chromo domain-containing protein n=1 Tax=Pisum sativum TaxID=3888 RepID=A0A9D5BRH6_PEA|nr:hypothetical protein KIW84_015671 [Pisum sativum]